MILKRILFIVNITALPYLSCNSLPVFDELAKRSIRFIQRCLLSECQPVKHVANYGVQAGRMLSPMGNNAFFCCQRFNVSVDDVLHLSALSLPEVTAGSTVVQLWLQFCSNFYVLEMEVTALNLKTVLGLLLTLLTVSVDIDILEVFNVFL